MSVYCGPLVCCRVKMVKEERAIQGDCPNGHRPPYHAFPKFDFCPQCGAKVSEKMETVEEEEGGSGEFFEFVSNYEDAMTSPGIFKGCRLFVPNDRRDPPRNFYLSEGEGVFDMDDRERCEEREWLGRAFAEEISELEIAYSTEAVSVVWGTIMWAN